jgi:hypothetical protein
MPRRGWGGRRDRAAGRNSPGRSRRPRMRLGPSDRGCASVAPGPLGPPVASDHRRAWGRADVRHGLDQKWGTAINLRRRRGPGADREVSLGSEACGVHAVPDYANARRRARHSRTRSARARDREKRRTSGLKSSRYLNGGGHEKTKLWIAEQQRRTLGAGRKMPIRSASKNKRARHRDAAGAIGVSTARDQATAGR